MDTQKPDQFIRLLREELQQFRISLKAEIVEEVVAKMDAILDKKLSGAMARLIKWEIPQVLLPKVLNSFLKPLVEEWMLMTGYRGPQKAIPHKKDDINATPDP